MQLSIKTFRIFLIAMPSTINNTHEKIRGKKLYIFILGLVNIMDNKLFLL